MSDASENVFGIVTSICICRNGHTNRYRGALLETTKELEKIFQRKSSTAGGIIVIREDWGQKPPSTHPSLDISYPLKIAKSQKNRSCIAKPGFFLFQFWIAIFLRVSGLIIEILGKFSVPSFQ